MADSNPGLYAWYCVVVLFLGQLFNFIHRQLLSILSEHVKEDLELTDSELGFLYGTAFSVCFCIAGIPLGRLADLYTRKNVLSASILAWSIFTCASGFANDYYTLIGFRMGVGVAQAGIAVSAVPMIADLFPARQRGIATSLFSTGVYVGGGVGNLIGGVIVDAWDRAFPNPDRAPFELKSWQATFVIIGAPGLLLALWVVSLLEPVRGRWQAEDNKAAVQAAARDKAKTAPLSDADPGRSMVVPVADRRSRGKAAPPRSPGDASGSEGASRAHDAPRSPELTSKKDPFAYNFLPDTPSAAAQRASRDSSASDTSTTRMAVTALSMPRIRVSPFMETVKEMAGVLPPFSFFYLLYVRASLRHIVVYCAVLGLTAGVTVVLIFPLKQPIEQWLGVAICFFCGFSWMQGVHVRDPTRFYAVFKRPSFILMMIGFSFYSFVNYALAFWGAPFFQRVHKQSTTTTGLALGIISAAAGWCGTSSGGLFSDFMKKRFRSGRIYTGVVGALGGATSSVSMLMVNNMYAAYTLAVPRYFFAGFHVGAAFAAVAEMVLPEFRATAASLWMLVTIATGMTLGPYAVGELSDTFQDSYELSEGQALRFACAIVACLYVFCVPFLLWSAKIFPAEEIALHEVMNQRRLQAEATARAAQARLSATAHAHEQSAIDLEKERPADDKHQHTGTLSVLTAPVRPP